MLGYGWDWQLFLSVAGFGLAIGMGWLLRHHRSLLPMFGGSVAAAVLFYAVSNLGSWFLLPYPRTWEGFWQAQTIGLAGFVPAWVFLKNSILANLAFTALFLLALRHRTGEWPEPQGALVAVRVRR